MSLVTLTSNRFKSLKFQMNSIARRMDGLEVVDSTLLKVLI